VTITLHLGVIDQPYAIKVPEQARRVRARSKRGGPIRASTAAPSGGESVYDVANILEEKYHVMEIFFEETQQAIADSIASALTDSLDRLIQTGAAPEDIFPREGQPEIQTAFNAFIDLRMMDGIQGGVPTGAAKRGVNHNLAHPYAKSNPERPSFKDTGLYRDSFRAWVEQS
jgi:hypothetical protein